MHAKKTLKLVEKNGPRFIDLFAGCGGLSLGLMQAGWIGVLAVERDKHAFETLKQNFLQVRSKYKYRWPSRITKEPIAIGSLLRKSRNDLESLRGSIELIVGGPPCQGFSMIGKRQAHDPRNQLYRDYLKMVKLIRPRFLIIENVKGITISFKRPKRGRGSARSQTAIKTPYSLVISEKLKKLGYETYTQLIHSSDYGVPQLRPRFILVAVDKSSAKTDIRNPFEILNQSRPIFLRRKGMTENDTPNVRDAISDLAISRSKLIPSEDSPGFLQIKYSGPKTNLQKLLHGSMNGLAPNSLRLANHSKRIQYRFRRIIKTCRKGVSLSEVEKRRFGIKKHCLVVLKETQPSHTLTTLPDDIIHYSNPRILTVRECARIQTFPDWFVFKGKYTTGGKMRTIECPRYTQVGNAVPPFLAEALGLALLELKRDIEK
jgi:DNA (cytosine-5)-methyltransferase 1